MVSDLHMLRNEIFHVSGENFDSLALHIFRYQAKANPVYSKFLHNLGIKPEAVEKVLQIPFLPVELFKNHEVRTYASETERIFESSGTTASVRSSHFVEDLSLYDKSLLLTFQKFFGDPQQYSFFALLPSYLERKNASLVYMIEKLKEASNTEEGGFFLHDHDKLATALKAALHRKSRKVFLAGVPFALLDFGEKNSIDLADCVILETGGMKGRRKEMIREELHRELHELFGEKAQIWSEYGMTELLSQAYCADGKHFFSPPWMKILVREPNDPFSYLPYGQSGGINVIDFANLYSCSFISTQDVGRSYSNGSFEVLGRFDFSDIRGCSLLYE